jgi:hypothetical protein
MVDPGVILIASLGSVLVLSTIDDRKVILSLSFYIQIFRQCDGIAFQCALAFAIERKIALTNDAYSKPLITIRSHNLHSSNIREAMHKIPSYHK